jgi:succinate-acetate transporter protein
MFVTTGWAEAGTLATVVTFAIAFGGVAQMWAGIASVSAQ